MAYGQSTVRSVRQDRVPNIFPSGPTIQSMNKHFIIRTPRFSFLFFFRVIKFAIGMLTYVAHFDRKVRIYIATKLFQFASRKEPYAILAGLNGFSRPCSRHRLRPLYGDFLNSNQARTGPYGSYDNF